MQLLWIIMFFIVSIINIYSQKKSMNNNITFIRLFTKPLLMPLLIAIYIAFSSKSEMFAMHLVIALAFGWLGDISLMIKGRHKNKLEEDINSNNSIYKNETNLKSVILGLLFFLCGHITYITIFQRTAIDLTGDDVIFSLVYLPFFAYAIIVFTYLCQHGRLPSLSSKMAVLVKSGILIYMVGISMMSYFSLLRLLNLKNTAAMFTFVGSLLFISSDTVLSLKIFGGVYKLSEQYIMASYIIAQLFIVMGYIIS